MDSEKYVKKVEALCAEAEAEVKSILAAQEGKYIYVADCEDMFEATTFDNVQISCFGVGLNEKGNLCVAAAVDNIGYGFSGDEYPRTWADITEERIFDSVYPDMYRFVVDNLAAATSYEAAEALRKEELDYDDEDE